MTSVVDILLTGWRRRALWSMALLAAVAAGTVGYRAGIIAGAGVAIVALVLVAAGLQWTRIEGPVMRLRDWRSGFGVRTQHARSVDRLGFRRSHGPQRIRRCVGPSGTSLLLLGPAPSTPIFRAVALWLIVHGRRQVRIDPVLLDALAAAPATSDAGQPHDTSHA